jgi:hypothetical protein
MFMPGFKDRQKMARGTVAKKSKSAPKGETSLHWRVAGLLNKHLAPPAWWTTFPAGGGGENRGKLLKSLGLKSGVPDILIFVPCSGTMIKYEGNLISSGTAEFHLTAVYGIELKKEGEGELSEAQKREQPLLAGANVRIVNCETMEQVHAALAAWAVPYRAQSPRQTSINAALEKTFGHSGNLS